MKWMNKGHEFDELGEKLIQHEKIYIYGAGDYGQKMFKVLDAIGCQVVFIDGNKSKQDNGYLGCKVISPIELFERSNKELVVICAVPQYAKEMKIKLENNNYIAGVDFYDMEEFCVNVLPIYSLYKLNKVYTNSIGFLSTTVCNLNCDGCLNFTAYNKNQKHQELEELKESIDYYFNNIDYVGFFSYTGGEPFLYPYIEDMLEYIGSKYINKINTFAISTNCTIIPSDMTCQIIKKYDMKIYIDDYSEFVEKSKKILPELIEKLESYHIDYMVNNGKNAYWIDLAPFSTDNSKLSDEELIKYREKCAVPYRELRDNKIYSCNYASFAIKANIQHDSTNDWYDLSQHKQDNNKILIEFLLGYTDKGYVDFCKHCAGFLPINPYKKPVGKQLPR